MTRMRTICLPVSLVLGVITATSARTSYAQVDLDDPDTKRTIRVVYDKTSALPDGAAFLTTMRSLFVVNTEDRDAAVAWVVSEMGLSRSDSEQFLDQMLNELRSFNADHDSFTRRSACSSDRPRAAGEEIYPVLEALDDATVTLAAQHLAAMKAEVGNEKAVRLQQWMEVSKPHITHVRLRHKEHYKQTGASPDETLHAICERVNAIKEGTPK